MEGTIDGSIALHRSCLHNCGLFGNMAFAQIRSHGAFQSATAKSTGYIFSVRKSHQADYRFAVSMAARGSAATSGFAHGYVITAYLSSASFNVSARLFFAGQASVAVVPTLQALSLPMTHAAGSHDVTGAAPSPLVSLSPDTHSPTTSGSQMNALFNTLCSPYAPLWSAAVAVTSNIIEQAAQASISLPAPLCFVRVKVSDLVHRICVLQSMNSALNFHSICYH